MQIDFRKYGDFPDAKTFLTERANFIEKSNEELETLHKKVKDGLLIMKEESNDEIILFTMPLKALVFREKHDIEAYVNKTYSYFGEYPIDTLEVYYGENIRSSERIAINWCRLNLRGKQPGKSSTDFCFTRPFSGWDDDELSWGNKFFFFNKEEYILFKETVRALGKQLGVATEPRK